MPLPDSSDIDSALVAKLGSDTALLALCPNGVYVNESPPASTRFVIVSLVDEFDAPIFGARAFEDALYLVEARMLEKLPTAPLPDGAMKAAAARIDALLEQGTLAPTGYALMTMHRESRVRLTEVDDVDASIRWQRRGGHYRVVMST